MSISKNFCLYNNKKKLNNISLNFGIFRVMFRINFNIKMSYEVTFNSIFLLEFMRRQIESTEQ